MGDARLSAPPGATCRYCFELGDEASPLIAPCACKGHQQWTHGLCLIKWQRHQGRGTVTCEVCKAPWTVQLDALCRECFLRSVRTNPRFPAVDSGEHGLDAAAQARLLCRMRPGTLIVQTPLRAQEHGAITMQTLQQQQALSVAQRAAGDGGRGVAGGVSPSASTLSLFANMLTLQRARHWLRGVYLIASRGDGDAQDGSDSLCAINLTRVATPQESDREALSQLAPLLGALGEGAPAPALLIGGPCHQTQPLVLLQVSAAAALPRRGDWLHVPMKGTAPPSRARFEVEWSHPAAAAAESLALTASLDASVQADSSDAVVPEEPEGGAEDAARSPTAEPSGGGGQEEEAAASSRGLPVVIAAEPAVAAAIIKQHGAAAVRLGVVQGIAIWSTTQLLSECSRHKWGLAEGALQDLPFGGPEEGGAEQEGADSTLAVDDSAATMTMAAATRPFAPQSLWAACWRDRNPDCSPAPPAAPAAAPSAAPPAPREDEERHEETEEDLEEQGTARGGGSVAS